jgi:arylsulfatase A-like enzyme
MKDMTDHAISYVRQQKTLAPDKPFFMYFAPGATHAPHQAPKEWIAKFKGKFDGGWDKMREETLERQKKMGIVPANTKLAPNLKTLKIGMHYRLRRKNFSLTRWRYLRLMQHTRIMKQGQLIDALESLGQLDNTLIFYIMGDNGASGEGRMNGLFNELTIINGIDEPIEMQLKNMDKLGGPEANNHYAAGWAVAGDAPFAG